MTTEDQPVQRGSAAELDALLARRPRGLRPLFTRYVMGRGSEVLFTADKLRTELRWDDNEEGVNGRRLRLVNHRLEVEVQLLQEQFLKIGPIITALALLIAFNPNAPTTRVVCVAIIAAMWVQMPRLKILQFRRRPDAGLDIGRLKTDFDEYYYLYCWLSRREQTTHAAEILVGMVTCVAIGVLVYVAITAPS